MCIFSTRFQVREVYSTHFQPPSTIYGIVIDSKNWFFTTHAISSWTCDLVACEIEKSVNDLWLLRQNHKTESHLLVKYTFEIRLYIYKN